MKIIQRTFIAHGGIEATNEDIAREIERKHGDIDLIIIFKYKGTR